MFLSRCAEEHLEKYMKKNNVTTKKLINRPQVAIIEFSDGPPKVGRGRTKKEILDAETLRKAILKDLLMRDELNVLNELWRSTDSGTIEFIKLGKQMPPPGF